MRWSSDGFRFQQVSFSARIIISVFFKEHFGSVVCKLQRKFSNYKVAVNDFAKFQCWLGERQKKASCLGNLCIFCHSYQIFSVNSNTLTPLFLFLRDIIKLAWNNPSKLYLIQVLNGGTWLSRYLYNVISKIATSSFVSCCFTSACQLLHQQI